MHGWNDSGGTCLYISRCKSSVEWSCFMGACEMTAADYSGCLCANQCLEEQQPVLLSNNIEPASPVDTLQLQQRPALPGTCDYPRQCRSHPATAITARVSLRQ